MFSGVYDTLLQQCMLAYWACLVVHGAFIHGLIDCVMCRLSALQGLCSAPGVTTCACKPVPGCHDVCQQQSVDVAAQQRLRGCTACRRPSLSGARREHVADQEGLRAGNDFHLLVQREEHWCCENEGG